MCDWDLKGHTAEYVESAEKKTVSSARILSIYSRLNLAVGSSAIILSAYSALFAVFLLRGCRWETRL